MPGTCHRVSHLIVTKALQGGYHPHLHFTVGETEVPNG